MPPEPRQKPKRKKTKLERQAAARARLSSTRGRLRSNYQPGWRGELEMYGEQAAEASDALNEIPGLGHAKTFVLNMLWGRSLGLLDEFTAVVDEAINTVAGEDLSKMAPALQEALVQSREKHPNLALVSAGGGGVRTIAKPGKWSRELPLYAEREFGRLGSKFRNSLILTMAADQAMEQQKEAAAGPDGEIPQEKRGNIWLNGEFDFNQWKKDRGL